MRFRPSSRIGVLLASAIMVAACGSSGATTSPTFAPSASAVPPTAVTASAGPSATVNATLDASPDLATFARIERQVEALRDLAPKAPVTPILLDEQGIRDWMTKAMESGVDHTALAAESRLFSHLGLLPVGASLEQLELDLDAGQALGFYDADTKQLYLLATSGTVGAEEQWVFSHEFTHALQDQNFGLDQLAIDAPNQSDRDLARTALPEGDATLSMMLWAERNMSILGLLSSAFSALGPQTDQFNSAPAILREDLMFPYDAGLSFVEGVYEKGGWAAVNRLYSKPPSSTSQILHPALYAAGIGPVAVSLNAVPAALGAGWKLSYQDTMGELQLRVWLEGEHPTDTQAQAADSAASGWAGDRIGLFEGPGGEWAVVLRTQWRSASGRTAFVAAANQTLAGLSSPSSVCGDATHADIIVASSSALLGTFSTCGPGV